MGYFGNGTEGMCYQEGYCFNCKNYRDKKDGKGFGCPIWDLHLFNSYKLCNSKSKAKEMLDFLIEIDKENCCNKKCSMFLPKRKTKKSGEAKK